MSDLAIRTGNAPTTKSAIRRITWAGFLLRIVLLMVMLWLKDSVSPYFISDDIAYEEAALKYLTYANSPIDLSYLKKITDGYMQPFWPTVMCLAAGISKTIYMGRVINICLSTACIPVIYKSTLLLCGNEKSALLAGKLFAFLPVTIITCCFPIKDIYLTWAVMYAFYIFLFLYKKAQVRTGQRLLCVLALIGVYYTRGAVTEMMVIFFVFIWIDALLKQKKNLTVLGVVVLAVIVVVLYGAAARDAFATKIEDYGGYNEASVGGLSMLQMTSVWQFYKLPFAYFFATLQPMTLNYAAFGDNFWMWLLRMSNVSIFPVAIANMLYVFQRKHNFVYWLCGAVIYCAIISMCLGIFRHYLFLIPLEMINCALCIDKKKRNTTLIIVLGTLGMILLVTMYSLLNLLR